MSPTRIAARWIARKENAEVLDFCIFDGLVVAKQARDHRGCVAVTNRASVDSRRVEHAIRADDEAIACGDEVDVAGGVVRGRTDVECAKERARAGVDRPFHAGVAFGANGVVDVRDDHAPGEDGACALHR